MTENNVQNIRPNNSNLVRIPEKCPDTLTWWADQYFNFEVTTSPRSQKEQHRDLNYFIQFLKRESGSDHREQWIPRISSAFQEYLRGVCGQDGKRHWSDRTINRMMAHLKTFSKWINKLMPFPLGDPMGKIKGFPIGSGLEIERALTPTERRRMLDYSDRLPETGGKSKDRHRYRTKERPVRKGFRPYRNRAIIYTLIETGMRRGAVCRINLDDIDFQGKKIAVQEKGGLIHSYKISNEGLEAIRDYIEKERTLDNLEWKSPALFLPYNTKPNPKGRLTSQSINQVWNQITEKAGVEGKTPHSARHAMGKHVIEKTGNVAAVQRVLGHKNAAYSMQYARITDKELDEVLNNRG